MRKWGVFLTIIVAVVFYFNRCTYDHLANPVVPKKDTTTTTTKKTIGRTNITVDNAMISPHVISCDPDTVYFTNVILPLISSNCAKSGCHDAASRVKGYNLTSYSGIMAIVSPGSPNGSKLYTYMSGIKKIMPPTGKLPQTDIDTIVKWINQGAKNNTCNASNSQCDSTNVSFATTIVPIINTYCKGCHNSSLQSGSVELDAYTGVLQVAQNGWLMGGITGALPQMPQTGVKLSNCDIGTIRQWIKEGAKNN